MHIIYIILFNIIYIMHIKEDSMQDQEIVTLCFQDS